MSIKPTVDKPRLNQWQNDDDQISQLIEHMQDKVLNINKWKFRIHGLNKYISYDEVIKKIQEKHPSPEYVQIMKDSFEYLPEKLEIMKQDIETVLKRFILNIQERMNYIDELEKYIQELENQEEKQDSTDFTELIKEEVKKQLQQREESESEQIPPSKETGEETPIQSESVQNWK